MTRFVRVDLSGSLVGLVRLEQEAGGKFTSFQLATNLPLMQSTQELHHPLPVSLVGSISHLGEKTSRFSPTGLPFDHLERRISPTGSLINHLEEKTARISPTRLPSLAVHQCCTIHLPVGTGSLLATSLAGVRDCWCSRIPNKPYLRLPTGDPCRVSFL